MIVFNGIALESIAPVLIKDIQVSPIRYSPVTRPRAVLYGSDFVRMRGGERTVTVTFSVLEENEVARNQFLQNISEWAKTDAEYILELPIEPNRYLKCVCTSKPEPSVRQWWESKLRLVFTCIDDPFWISKAEKSVEGNTQFTVLGDAPPLMRIERTLSSAVTNQGYTNGTETMQFSTTPAGNLVIDLNRQTAVVGSSSIMQYFIITGQFLIPRTGTQTITGSGTIKYRERWK